MIDESFVLTASSKRHHWKGEGLCSIKTFSNGDAYYNTGKGFYRVDNQSILLLNNKTDYEILIDNEKKIDSFCIFFSSALLKDLHSAQTRRPAYLLDNYNYHTEETIYHERTYETQSLDHVTLSKFKSDYTILKTDRLWLEESYVQLLGMLPGIKNINVSQRSNLALQKMSTKNEIFGRVLMAREYLHSHIYSSPTLHELSRVSLLSVNLLIKYFKQAFGLTPHQYFIDIKMEKAKELLGDKYHSVTDVCSRLRLESIGSFGNLFKRKTGVSPGAFQKK